MRTGKLRHKLLIQSFSGTRDTAGHKDKKDDSNWSTDATGTVWGSVEPLRGQELEEARKLAPTVTHQVKLRHLVGLTMDKRIKFGARIFSIEAGLNPEERNVELVLSCTEQL